MNRSRTPLVALGLGTLTLLGTAMGAPAQSVSTTNALLRILDSQGDPVILIDNTADYEAGGDGRSAALILKGSDGPPTLTYQAFQAQLILGGGSHDGIVLLKDDDGVTTTIELDGEFGAIWLGGNGEDGDLVVFDNAENETFRVDGQIGHSTNQLNAEGQVKAWARIAADGSVLSCWRCDPEATSKQGANPLYTVDFGPLGPDVQSRPRMVVLDSHQTSVEGPGAVRLMNSTTPTAVVVWITEFEPMEEEEPGFTLFIY